MLLTGQVCVHILRPARATQIVVFTVTLNLRPVQLLGHLGTHLCRVTIDGLTITQNQVHLPQHAYGLGKGIRGGQGVGTGEASVGHQDDPVCTPVERLSQKLGRLWQSHGQDRDLSTVALLDLKYHL